MSTARQALLPQVKTIAWKKRPFFDPIGHYFTCFESAMGAPVLVDIQTTLQTGVIELDQFDHALHDGQGALTYFQSMRAEEPMTLPQHSREKRPSWRKQVLGMGHYLRLLLYPPQPTFKKNQHAVGRSRASDTFSLAETKALHAWTRKEAISMSAFLLWSLHRAIGIQSGQTGHRCRWSVPVNMRGAVQFDDALGNYAVPLFMALEGPLSLQEVHQTLAQQLAAQLHWGALRVIQVLSLLNRSIYCKIIRQDELKMAKTGQWFAIFSNIGAIRGDSRVKSKAIFPPVDPNCPLFATALSWNGQLTIALTVHAALAEQRLEAASLLVGWKAFLQGQGFLQEPSRDSEGKTSCNPQ